MSQQHRPADHARCAGRWPASPAAVVNTLPTMIDVLLRVDEFRQATSTGSSTTTAVSPGLRAA
jgi:hypothetical protein